VLLAQLEEAVKNAVSDTTDDPVLARLVDLTVRSIQSNRELFDNPLHEPVFYVRHFKPWVEQALVERDALDKFHGQALKNLGLQ
jgi:hypothetical protein